MRSSRLPPTCLTRIALFINFSSIPVRSAPAAMAQELETALLGAVGAGPVESGEFAAAQNVPHLQLVGLLKSLQASDMITMEASRAGRCRHSFVLKSWKIKICACSPARAQCPTPGAPDGSAAATPSPVLCPPWLQSASAPAFMLLCWRSPCPSAAGASKGRGYSAVLPYALARRCSTPLPCPEPLRLPQPPCRSRRSPMPPPHHPRTCTPP